MSKTTWRDKLNTDQQALIEDILKQLPPSAVWGYEALLNKIAAPKYRYLIIDDNNEVQGTDDEDIVMAADDSGDCITLLTEAIPEASRSDWNIDEDEDEEDDE